MLRGGKFGTFEANVQFYQRKSNSNIKKILFVDIESIILYK